VDFSLNYLANVPEVLDLAKRVKSMLAGCFVFSGGHSGSFIAEELLDHANGAIDCVVKGDDLATDAPMRKPVEAAVG
jgi:hopanoid C-3 methylase